MTHASKTKLRLTGLAAGLALAMNLFAAPEAVAGDRGDRWERDRSPRIERHYDRDRDRDRAKRRYRRNKHRYAHRHWRRHEDRYAHRHGRRHKRQHHRHSRRRGDSVAPIIAGIGLGIITYAILNHEDRY